MSEREVRMSETSALDLQRRPVVLFDFDGTLADTSPGIHRVVRATVAPYGIEPTQDQLLRMVGPPLVVGFHEVMGFAEEEVPAVVAEYRRLFEVLLGPEDYPPISGMPALVRDLRAAGRRAAVATSRRQESAEQMLADIHMRDLFDTVVGECAGARLTKADCIRQALSDLGAAPTDAVMVGDRTHDVEGAREAGLPCIGLYSGTSRPGELEAAGAAAVVHGADELREVLLGPACSSAEAPRG